MMPLISISSLIKMTIKNIMFLCPYQINFELILVKKNKKGKMINTFPLDEGFYWLEFCCKVENKIFDLNILEGS
jgi:hypothetical protein